MDDSEAENAVAGVTKGRVQQKINRLHSLLFGVDAAFSKGDIETSLGLGLRLLGFLESECETAEDVAYVEPVKKQVIGKIDAAMQGTKVDRYAYTLLPCLFSEGLVINALRV